MAFSAHTNEEQMKERYDSDEVLDQKTDKLVELIRNSNHFVTFTGAGVSTSAGIPDFRGPDGVWTLKAQNKSRVNPTVRPISAFPTATHMSLVGLQNANILKYLISQNCDGLHRKSSIKPDIEECRDCGKQFFRDFPAHRISRGRDHFTGRFCVVCGGKLDEWTIDFGQNLPVEPLVKAKQHSKKADLHLVLGSSLTVSPACKNIDTESRKIDIVFRNYGLHLGTILEMFHPAKN